jgi:putative MATE family efflux protein
MNTALMTQGAPWRHIIRFALPVLLGSLLQQLYNTVDAIVVGNFSGEASLSAVGTTGSLTFLFLTIALGFSAGNGVIVAQHYGANDLPMVRKNASTGILFLMTLGVGFSVLGFVIARPAFSHFVGVPKGYLDLTVRYFRIYALGLIFQYGYNSFSAILRAVGDSAATLYFLLIASVLNILLDLLFVAVFRWGVTGAAAATVIAQAASFFSAYLYMTRRYPIFRFIPSDYRWDGAIIRRTVAIGMPISLHLMIVSIGLTLIQRAVNSFGQAMTASFTVGNRIEQYLNLPFNAFQTTLATYTGQNIGAGRLDRVKTGVRQTIVLSLVLTLVISGAVWLLAGNIITLFGLSDQAADYCLRHLRTVALVNVILALYVPLFGVFQGAGHSGVPAVVATCSLTARVLSTYLFKDSPFLGYRIIWWNGLFGFAIGLIVSWVFYFSGRWQVNANIETRKKQIP